MNASFFDDSNLFDNTCHFLFQGFVIVRLDYQRVKVTFRQRHRQRHRRSAKNLGQIWRFRNSPANASRIIKMTFALEHLV